jgi:hypothetical protein
MTMRAMKKAKVCGLGVTSQFSSPPFGTKRTSHNILVGRQKPGHRSFLWLPHVRSLLSGACSLPRKIFHGVVWGYINQGKLHGWSAGNIPLQIVKYYHFAWRDLSGPERNAICLALSHLYSTLRHHQPSFMLHSAAQRPRYQSFI